MQILDEIKKNPRLSRILPNIKVGLTDAVTMQKPEVAAVGTVVNPPELKASPIDKLMPNRSHVPEMEPVPNITTFQKAVRDEIVEAILVAVDMQKSADPNITDEEWVRLVLREYQAYMARFLI